MNRFSLSLLSLIVMALLFVTTSCKDDDEQSSAAPSITFTGIDQPEAISVNPGQSVDFTVNVNAPGCFSALTISKNGGLPLEPVTVTSDETEQRSYQYQFSFSPSIEEAGQTIIFTFEAIDEGGQEGTATYSVTVNTPIISDYQEVVIGGRYNKAIGHFYSMLDNEVYHHEEALEHPEQVDFLFYYNQEKQFTITAPSDAYARIVYGNSVDLAGMENQTFFARSSADFDAITKPEHIVDAWQNTALEEPLTVIHYLEVGNVFVFRLDETRGGRYGIARVVELADPADPGTRYIKLHIKITMEEHE